MIKKAPDRLTPRKSKSQMAEAWDRLKRRPMAVVSMVGLVLIVLIAVFADVLVDYQQDVVQQDVYNKLASFSPEHWLGTDYLGRDLFARIIYGTRIALVMGLGANLLTVALALVLSCCCAFFGGKVDLIIMRFVDILMSLPSLVLSIAICAGLGNGLWQLIIALAVGNLGPMTTMFRSSALTIAHEEYMEAGKALGASNAWLMVKYMIPNMMSIILVQATSYVGMNILSGATLSFIGLGVKAPMPEWGMILNDGLQYFTIYPRLVIIPGIAILLTAFFITTFGDCLRDAFDPKLKGRA